MIFLLTQASTHVAFAALARVAVVEIKFQSFSVQNSRDNMSVILVSLENAPKAEEAEIAQFKKVDEQIVQDMKGKRDERV